MQCSACAAFSLRGFLKALINVELRPVFTLNDFTSSRRRIHESSTTRIQALPYQDRAIWQQQNAVDTRLKRPPYPSMLPSPASSIHVSQSHGQERPLGPPSALLTHAERQTEASASRSPADKLRRQQSIPTELTGSIANLSVPTSAGRGAVSVSASASGRGQDFLLGNPCVEGTSQQSSANMIKSVFKKGDGNRGLGPGSFPFRKSCKLSSAIGRLVASGNVQSRIRSEQRQREPWQAQKNALKAKFGSSSWSPRKRLSPDALEGIRALHSQYPDRYTTPVLADQFKVSPEAVRRILRSKWRANEEEEAERRQRWDKRGAVIWSRMVETGIKPPKKWRDMGIGRGRNHLKVWRRERPRASAWDSGNASVPGQEPGLRATLSDRIL